MIIMNRKLITILLLACMVSSLRVCGQTVRTITVAQGAPYTDHLSLVADSRDTDLMVKFAFNEEANTLTVSLISYRDLFVFWEDVRCKPAFKGRKLRPDMLPYVAAAEEGDVFRMTRDFKRSIPSPRRKHVFKRWIDYEGLQPVPVELKMVNEFVEQTFDIVNKRTAVVVRLRDLFLMEHVQNSPTKNKYLISYGRDMNLEYRVQIQRNPCFGFDEEMASAKTALAAISSSYKSLAAKYAGGKVASEQELALFSKAKDLLLGQYNKREAESPCPDIQQALTQYNMYIDSLQQLKCVVAAPVDSAGGKGGGASKADLDVQFLLSNARQLDKNVSRWLSSKDVIERRDIIRQCKDIVVQTLSFIGEHTGNTPQQQNAVKVFHQAVAFFRNTCSVE